jgi:hypothetical protein
MPQSVLTRIWDTIAGGQPVDRWFGGGDKNVDVLRRIVPDELWQRDVDANGVRGEWKARP